MAAAVTMALPDDASSKGEYSGWRAGALVVCLLTAVAQMIAFLSPFWAVPATRDYDPNLEGIGIWKYCRWEKGDNADKHICRDHESLPGRSSLPSSHSAHNAHFTG